MAVKPIPFSVNLGQTPPNSLAKAALPPTRSRCPSLPACSSNRFLKGANAAVIARRIRCSSASSLAQTAVRATRSLSRCSPWAAAICFSRERFSLRIWESSSLHPSRRAKAGVRVCSGSNISRTSGQASMQSASGTGAKLSSASAVPRRRSANPLSSKSSGRVSSPLSSRLRLPLTSLRSISSCSSLFHAGVSSRSKAHATRANSSRSRSFSAGA